MILQWFNARQASEAGAALADKLTPSAARIDRSGVSPSDGTLVEIVRRAQAEVRGLRLNFYQRAKLANAFKWRLIENGIERNVADEVTQSIVVDMSMSRRSKAGVANEADPAPISDRSLTAAQLLAKGNKLFEQGDYNSALACYAELLNANPRHAEALNNVGSVLFKLGRYIEAEQHYRGAIAIMPAYPEALSNLGNVLRRRGYFSDAVVFLRRAVHQKPNYWSAHCDLGYALTLTGDIRGAKARFKKVLKAKPQHIGALLGMEHLVAMEGHWEEAGKLLDRVMEMEPKNAMALVARASLRKQTLSDAPWLQAAEEIAAGEIDPYEESVLRFSIGKYFDDVGQFALAFESYKRANEILKPSAEPYDRKKRTQLVQDLMEVYTRDAVAQPPKNASTSTVPVFVVGMPRSGTTLMEQIICSHPSAKAAGELSFWFDAAIEHETAIRKGLTDESVVKTLAESYLLTLRAHSEDALRIVDKAPLNSDYLSIIHRVFPKARIIYMQRDPVDTCLSCYFHGLPLTANFSLDLSDLAHYYREHKRLMGHWRTVLPAGTILDVPYADLVADQASWTRKVLDFIGLDWNEKCLNFEQTERPVATASFWQVRQKIYSTSVARWRNYEKFIGPLRRLREG
jgi:tetratricopeptide (TPR) repeat protein